jgi:hypothetical protein
MDPADKLDAFLWELLSSKKLQDEDAISVLIRCEASAFNRVASQIESLNGRIQRRIPGISLIVAWIPANRVLNLASETGVLEIANEDEYAIA